MSHNEIVPASELTVRPLASESLYPNVSSQARGSEEEGVQEEGVEAEGAEGAPGEDEDTEETPERARGEKVRRKVFYPSNDEIRAHRITHCPFRSWCPKCVAGRGHQGPHRRSEEPLNDVPQISIDYCFLRRGPDERSVPVLVARVRRLNLVFAHVVPFKGGGHREVIALLARDLQRCGFHGKVILKGDQENAIQDLMHEVARHRGAWKLCLSIAL